MNRSLILGVVVIAVVIAALYATLLHARDLDGRYANSALKPWFDHLASGKGLCCSMADGETVDDPDWESKGDCILCKPSGEVYKVIGHNLERWTMPGPLEDYIGHFHEADRAARQVKAALNTLAVQVGQAVQSPQVLLQPVNQPWP